MSRTLTITGVGASSLARADRRSLVERCDRTGERYERWRLATLAAVLSSPAFDYAVDALIVASGAAFALEPHQD